MKKVSVILSAAVMLAALTACNNETKDSVEEADSINKANIDSPATNTNQGVVADEATASFMVKAADGGMAEVQLGELAQQKASSQRVKDFASMMVRDHSEMNEKLKSMAAQRNVVLPSSVSNEHRDHVNDLTAKSGKDFDKAYMRHMVDDHQSTINMFEKASNDVKDTETKNLIDNALPKLRSHLDSAKAVQKSLR